MEMRPANSNTKSSNYIHMMKAWGRVAVALIVPLREGSGHCYAGVQNIAVQSLVGSRLMAVE